MQLYSTLYTLAQIDRKLAILAAENEDFIAKRIGFQKQVAKEQAVITKLEQQLSAVATQLKTDETKLEDEQHHISDRRKQMSSLGGNKQAKLLEREIDVARRSLDQLESQTLQSMEQREKVSEALEKEKSMLLAISEGANAQAELAEASIQNNLELSVKLKKQREEIVPLLDTTVLRTYDRIRGKYPAEPVARMAEGHCQSCYRALPPQVANLVALGQQVQQCPGCHRLLILVDEAAAE